MLIFDQRGRMRFLFIMISTMSNDELFDVIVIGGSYAGLSAALALGRSMRRTLIIDAGEPCNRFAAHSHNFLTQDGEDPQLILESGRNQVLAYPSVQWLADRVIKINSAVHGFDLQTDGGVVRRGKRLILATGMRDRLPAIPGIAECWGKTIVHCPYCHGYEFRGKNTSILGSGQKAFHLATLVRRLAAKLTVINDGAESFTEEQRQWFDEKHVVLPQASLMEVDQLNGGIQQLILDSGQRIDADVLYVMSGLEQSDLIQELACGLTDSGHLQVDAMNQTTIPGVFACGDNVNLMRSVAAAVAAGNMTGAMVNMLLAQQEH